MRNQVGNLPDILKLPDKKCNIDLFLPVVISIGWFLMYWFVWVVHGMRIIETFIKSVYSNNENRNKYVFLSHKFTAMKKIFLLSGLLVCHMLIYAQLTGVRFVPSTNYPNFKSIVDSINLYGVGGGGIVFEMDGNQTYSTPLVNITATGTSGSAITIRWNNQGQKPVLNFSGTAALAEAGITLSGTDFFNLEGVTILSQNNMLEYGILLTCPSTTDGCQYNNFKNITLTLDKTNTNQTEGIRVVSPTAPTAQSGTHAHNKFINNTISNCLIGYYFDSNTGTVSLMGFDNEVGTSGTGASIITDISLCGVYLKGQNGAKVHHTQITNLERIGTGVTAPAAIATASNNPNTDLTGTFDFYNNLIENHTSSFTSIFGFYLNARKSVHNLYNNQIRNITATGGGTNTACGIIVFGTSITANIYNNFLSGIAAPASAVSGSPATRGIELRTFSLAHVYYNTVKLNYDATHASNSSGSLTIINEADPVYLKNNIFINTTTLPAGATGVAAAFYKSSPVITNIQASTTNNFYYAGVPSASHPVFFGYNSISPTVCNTLEQYQSFASTFDQTAFTGELSFLSGNDLHVNPFDTLVREKAVPVLQPFTISTDIDGQLRSSQNPDLGADELIELFPLNALNPYPASETVIAPEYLDSLSWDYTDDNQHLLPAGFKCLIDTSPSLGQALTLWIPYIAGKTHYSLHNIEDLNLDYLTSYYWKVLPVTAGPDSIEAIDQPVWSFSTIYPYPAVANYLSPENEQSGMPVSNISFRWEYQHNDANTLPTGFKIYLGTDPVNAGNEIGFIAYNSQQSQFLFLAESVELEYQTDYYWKIVPVAGIFETPGQPVWSFTTKYSFPALPSCLFPSDGQTGLSVTADSLAWQYIHDSVYSVPVGFKIYFGTDSLLSESHYAGFADYFPEINQYFYLTGIDSLEYETAYFWKIVPVSDTLHQVFNPDCPTWHFVTEIDNYIGNDKPICRKLDIFPNPSDGFIYLVVDVYSTITVYTCDGRLLMSHEYYPGRVAIPLQNVSAGLYYIKVENNHQAVVEKIIIK